MSKEFDMKQYEEGMKYHENSMKHWRAWGSWFSWGSPVGLGLFFVELSGAVWLLSKAFHW
jgi:hypothetical protein